MRQFDAGWSSLVARRAHNPKVVGSNPAPATNIALKWAHCVKPLFTGALLFLDVMLFVKPAVDDVLLLLLLLMLFCYRRLM